jgi:hypothetical protein
MESTKMSSYWDLEPCEYFDRREPYAPEESRIWSVALRAVGWLGYKIDFPQGTVPVTVRQRLGSLLKGAWQPCVFMGSYECGLCVQAIGDITQDHVTSEGRSVNQPARGSNNIFIPGSGFVYVAPELILHYVDRHLYVPPEEFCDAVLACPPMGTPVYFRALRRNSSGDFARLIPGRRWWHF